MTTDDFIDNLEQRRLISAGIARQLRAKAAQGDNRINPKSILKYLVKKEIVSREAAKEILQTTLIVSDKAESSILGNVPIARDDQRPSKPARPRSTDPGAGGHAEPRRGSSLPGDDLFSAAQAAASIAPSQVGDADSDEVVETFALGEEPGAETPAKSRDRKKKKKKGKKEKGKSEWDSPLVLIGGSGLALLLIAGVVLYYLLTRENADEALKQANDHFEGGQYTQAISDYQGFIENWPSHEDISEARVRLGIAKIRKDTDVGREYDVALQTAQRVIDEIEDEPAFTSEGADDRGLTEGKRELSELLTKIAEGLAQQADAATDPALINQRVQQIQEALALTANTKYVPDLLRQGDRLSAVRDTLGRVQQRLERDADLEKTLAEMDEAIAAGNTAAAFTARSTIIDKHPVLVDDASLAEKILKIAAAEQALIKFVEDRRPALTEAPATPVVAEIALAERRGAPAESAPASGAGPLVIRIDGALYALDPSNGALLWRHFIGLDGVNSYPLTLPDGNVVAANSQRGELVCLNAQNAKLIWRQPLEGRLATPVLAGERLVIASDAGKLYALDPSSGELLGHVLFTQPLRVPPAVNEAGDRLYLVGDHSNLYTLSTRDFSCLGVQYVGHSAGGVVVPPLVVLNKVAVADNSGAETCLLRLLAVNEQGAVDKAVAVRRLAGLVTTPLHKAGRRFATVTTRGQAIVFEVGAGDDNSALTAIAAREPQDREQIARFSLLHEGALWSAGNQLMKLAILPTGNQLPVRSLDRDYRGDAFDYPLQLFGNELVHVRRPHGRGGAIVAAMDASANRALWETEIAVPLAGPPAADVSALRITAGASSGAVFLVDRDAMARRVQDQAVRADAAAPSALFTDSLDLAQGRMVLGAVGAPQMLLYRPDDPRQPLTPINLPGPLSCAPIAWGDGFVAATDVGQVFLYDATTGAPRGAPFQPELTPGRQYHWLRPALVGAGADAQLVISDGMANVYLVGSQSQPQPHLEAVATSDIGPSPLSSPMAIAGNRAFAGNEGGGLASFTLPELNPNDPVQLGGRVTWGPFPLPDGLLLATDADEIIFLGGDGAVRWRQKLARGALAGTPLVDGNSALLLYSAGHVARINLADGAEAGAVELSQPAVEGPVPFGPRLILAAPDGSLLVANRP